MEDIFTNLSFSKEEALKSLQISRERKTLNRTRCSKGEGSNDNNCNYLAIELSCSAVEEETVCASSICRNGGEETNSEHSQNSTDTVNAHYIERIVVTKLVLACDCPS